MTTFEDSPEAVGAALKQFQDDLLPPLRKEPGYRGAYVLVDKATGHGSVITLWSSEDALQASEDRAASLRADATEEQDAAGLTVWRVDRYEVLTADVAGGSRISSPSPTQPRALGARIAQSPPANDRRKLSGR